MSNEQQEKPRTAVERLNDLEGSIKLLDNAIGQLMGRDDRNEKAISLLSKKLEAIKRSVGLSDETVAKLLVEIDLEDLKKRVSDMVGQGLLSASDIIDAEKSFVVARELSPDGLQVSQERIQFAVFTQSDEAKAALAGKKVGDLVKIVDGMNLVDIQEIYSISLPAPAAQAGNAPAADQASASADAPSEQAPAAEESSNDQVAPAPADAASSTADASAPAADASSAPGAAPDASAAPTTDASAAAPADSAAAAPSA